MIAARPFFDGKYRDAIKGYYPFPENSIQGIRRPIQAAEATVQVLPLVFMIYAAPAGLRCSALDRLGFFGAAGLLAASAITGLLWTTMGASMTCVADAAFSAVALVGLLTVRAGNGERGGAGSVKR